MAKTFDETELMDRVDNDAGFLAETVEMLVADGPSLLEQVRSAAAVGDAAGVGKHAHALKGMISNFCAPEAQACALQLEKMGKAGDLSTIGPAMEQMSSVLEGLTAELQAFVKEKA